MLEQTSPSYGGLKLGLFVTKGGLFAQFQRAPFGKSSQKMAMKRLSLRDLASSGHVFDSSDCKSPSKCFLLSNFDIPAYYLGWIFEKVIDSYKLVSGVPPPSLSNFPVPSSYKNGNCLNIRTSLDILDNILPRK